MNSNENQTEKEVIVAHDESDNKIVKVNNVSPNQKQIATPSNIKDVSCTKSSVEAGSLTPVLNEKSPQKGVMKGGGDGKAETINRTAKRLYTRTNLVVRLNRGLMPPTPSKNTDTHNQKNSVQNTRPTPRQNNSNVHNGTHRKDKNCRNSYKRGRDEALKLHCQHNSWHFDRQIHTTPRRPPEFLWQNLRTRQLMSRGTYYDEPPYFMDTPMHQHEPSYWHSPMPHWSLWNSCGAERHLSPSLQHVFITERESIRRDLFNDQLKTPNRKPKNPQCSLQYGRTPITKQTPMKLHLPKNSQDQQDINIIFMRKSEAIERIRKWLKDPIDIPVDQFNPSAVEKTEFLNDSAEGITENTSPEKQLECEDEFDVSCLGFENEEPWPELFDDLKVIKEVENETKPNDIFPDEDPLCDISFDNLLKFSSYFDPLDVNFELHFFDEIII